MGKKESKRSRASSEGGEETGFTHFRAGVGAVIEGPRSRVLALERRDVAGAWQLPQGGLKPGEEPRAAVEREIREETGIEASDLVLLEGEPRLLAYELPASMRTRKMGRGQTQYWFRFRFVGPDEKITLGNGKEFKAWRWMTMEELVSIVAPFRRALYRELAGR